MICFLLGVETVTFNEHLHVFISRNNILTVVVRESHQEKGRITRQQSNEIFLLLPRQILEYDSAMG